jgi:hypothetical protein
MSKETGGTVYNENTDEFYSEYFCEDSINYYAERSEYSDGNDVSMWIMDSRYSLDIGDFKSAYTYRGFEIAHGWDIGDGKEYDEILDIKENIIGKSLIDFFCDEEFVTAIEYELWHNNDNNYYNEEIIYGNNIRVIANDLYYVDVYLYSSDYYFGITLSDDGTILCISAAD